MSEAKYFGNSFEMLTGSRLPATGSSLKLYGYFRRNLLNIQSTRVLYFSVTFTFDKIQIRKRNYHLSEKFCLLTEFGWLIYHTNSVILCSQIVKSKLQIIREIIHKRKS